MKVHYVGLNDRHDQWLSLQVSEGDGTAAEVQSETEKIENVTIASK